MAILEDMSFEQGFKEDNPQELWRVISWRQVPNQNRKIRHTNWFATEEAAKKHAEWINNGRGEVISIAKYLLEDERHA